MWNRKITYQYQIMKKTLLLLSLVVLSAASSNAAITLGGAYVTQARKNDNTANIATNSIALLIVDMAGDGFFNFGNVSDNTVLTIDDDPDLTSEQASMVAGQTFGGELILNRHWTLNGSVLSPLPNTDISNYLNKAFAIVIFDGVLTSTTATNAPAGSKFTVLRGSDWVLPASNSGGFLASSTDSGGADTYYQVNANNPGAGSVNFRTTNGAAIFSVVPEPSTTLLGAFGALALLRRRRN